MGCRHHARARRTRETWGRWDHGPCRRRSREWSWRYLSLLKCSRCFVNQALGLLFHPFLVVVFHVLLVLPTAAVRLSHRWRIMGKIRITVVAIKLRHVVPQAVGYPLPRRREMTHTARADSVGGRKGEGGFSATEIGFAGSVLWVPMRVNPRPLTPDWLFALGNTVFHSFNRFQKADPLLCSLLCLKGLSTWWL